jgi:hypothetical protein
LLDEKLLDFLRKKTLDFIPTKNSTSLFHRTPKIGQFKISKYRSVYLPISDENGDISFVFLKLGAENLFYFFKPDLSKENLDKEAQEKHVRFQANQAKYADLKGLKFTLKLLEASDIPLASSKDEALVTVAKRLSGY